MGLHPGACFTGKGDGACQCQLTAPSLYYLYFAVLSEPAIIMLFTGAQPKAGTGHKIQSISVVFSTLHCEGCVADLRYRWLITSGSARWRLLAGSLKFYPPFWKARGMEDSQQKDYSFWGNDTFPSLYDTQVFEWKFKSEYLERQFY